MSQRKKNRWEGLEMAVGHQLWSLSSEWDGRGRLSVGLSKNIGKQRT